MEEMLRNPSVLGLITLIIVGLSVAVKTLYRDLKHERKELKELMGKTIQASEQLKNAVENTNRIIEKYFPL